MDYNRILNKYYIPNSPLYELLVAHSRQVADFALAIINSKQLSGVDRDLTETAAMLHDIGIIHTNAPSILCYGTENYMRHGIIGANMLRSEGAEWEPIARVCETHIGAGLTAAEIEEQNLPLPHRDFLPITVEERLVCYADNFFSKSHIAPPISIDTLRAKMQRYGAGTMERLESLISQFGFPDSKITF